MGRINVTSLIFAGPYGSQLIQRLYGQQNLALSLEIETTVLWIAQKMAITKRCATLLCAFLYLRHPCGRGNSAISDA